MVEKGLRSCVFSQAVPSVGEMPLCNDSERLHRKWFQLPLALIFGLTKLGTTLPLTGKQQPSALDESMLGSAQGWVLLARHWLCRELSIAFSLQPLWFNDSCPEFLFLPSCLQLPEGVPHRAVPSLRAAQVHSAPALHLLPLALCQPAPSQIYPPSGWDI